MIGHVVYRSEQFDNRQREIEDSRGKRREIE